MKSSVRWLVPVAVVATVTGGVAVSSAQAGNSPDLPVRTAQQVLASVAASHVTALAGTVVTRADIGLPSLGGLTGDRGPEATTDPTGLITRFLSGKNTLRVWADGPTKQRAQLVDPMAELDVVRNGSDVWTYTSRGNQVQHATLPARTGAHAEATKPGGSALAQLTPDQLATKAIAAADPTTTVSLGANEQVAGRGAYALTLTPKTDGTLVGRIVIAVDAQRGVPLQVKVFARGKAQPAIESGFTAIDFATPSADRFTFTPPKGATVTELKPPADLKQAKPDVPASAKPKVIGKGWTTIVEIPASALQAAAARGAESGLKPGLGSGGGGSASGSGDSGRLAQGLSMLQQLTTSTPAGQGITTSLLSVLLTNDGRVLVGAVPLKSLVDAAGQK